MLENFKESWSERRLKEKAALAAPILLAVGAFAYCLLVLPAFAAYSDFCRTPASTPKGLFESAFAEIRENVRAHVCERN